MGVENEGIRIDIYSGKYDSGLAHMDKNVWKNIYFVGQWKNNAIVPDLTIYFSISFASCLDFTDL